MRMPRGIDGKPTGLARAPNGAEAPGSCNGRLIYCCRCDLSEARSKGDLGGVSQASPRTGPASLQAAARLAASSRCAYVRLSRRCKLCPGVDEPTDSHALL